MTSLDDLPVTWASASLANLCIDIKQRTPAPDEQFTYIDIASIDRDLKQIKEPQILIGQAAPSRARKIIEANDVLVSMTRPNLNAVALVQDDFFNPIASTGFDVLRTNLIEPKWLYFHVRSQKFIETLLDKVQGALYPAVKSSDIRSYEIPIPPLAEQQEIATRLDDLLAQVDTIKARLDALPAILKRFRQAVLAAAVSGKLTEDINTVSWSYIPLGSLIDQGPQNGLYKPSTAYGKGVKIIRIDNFYDGYITNWGKVKKLEVSNEELNTWKLNLLDVLINRVNSIEYLGKCALVTDLPESTVFESNIMRLSLNRSLVNPHYIRIFLTSLIGIERLRVNAKRAVNQASINQQDVKRCLVNLPPLSEQTEIVKRVEQLFAFADQIEQQVQAAQTRVNQLTQAILTKAFKGELTADWRAAHPELISGEHSAEALLEKIKATQIPNKPKRGKAKQGELNL